MRGKCEKGIIGNVSSIMTVQMKLIRSLEEVFETKCERIRCEGKDVRRKSAGVYPKKNIHQQTSTYINILFIRGQVWT